MFQRLLLGGLLLFALVTGLSLLVRGGFVALSGLDGEQKQMDRAVASLAGAQAALDREQILIERSLLRMPSDEPARPAAVAEPTTPPRQLPSPAPPPREPDIVQQSQRAQARLITAHSALAELPATGSTPQIDRELHEHAIVLERLRHYHPTLAMRMLSGQALEGIDASLSAKLQTLQHAREQLLDALDSRRAWLRARLIGFCLLSIVSAAAVVLAMLAFTTRPLRLAAHAARRMGQGDLQQRIDWPRNDELGVLATEFNRLAIRVRDLRETEGGRREMEHQLSDAVVQSLFEPVIVTDGRGQLLKLNKAARALLGDSSGRMVLSSTPGGEQILAAIQTAVSLERPVGGEGDAAVAPIRIGEAQRNFRLRTTPMRDNEGHLLGAVSVLEDVTELEEVDRFKTRFLAIASQKLRDPLEKLRLAIHALARGYAGELRPLQADVVEGARCEAEHLDDLMADLFAVAELDSNRRALRLERLRPLDLLTEAQANIRAAATERGLTVELDAYADLQRVEADRRALRSVFENLLSNAVRNTPSGGYIRLSATESKAAVQFSVADTGMGIEPERLARIFGRFNSGSTDGTGLGLALVRRLVEAQGGQVSVESRPGAGTTFTFTLPAPAAADTWHPVEVG